MGLGGEEVGLLGIGRATCGTSVELQLSIGPAQVLHQAACVTRQHCFDGMCACVLVCFGLVYGDIEKIDFETDPQDKLPGPPKGTVQHPRAVLYQHQHRRNI
jgi:hypothetical protein